MDLQQEMDLMAIAPHGLMMQLRPVPICTAIAMAVQHTGEQTAHIYGVEQQDLRQLLILLHLRGQAVP